jgi:Na+/proline symporter
MIAPKIRKNISPDPFDRRLLNLNRIMVLVPAVVSFWFAIAPPKFLTVLLWTRLGGFTVAISPSLILGCFVPLGHKSCHPSFDDPIDCGVCIFDHYLQHASLPGDRLRSDRLPGSAPDCQLIYQARAGSASRTNLWQALGG